MLAVLLAGGVAVSCVPGAPRDPGTVALDELSAPGDGWTYDQAYFPAGSDVGRAWGRPVVAEALEAVCGQALDWLDDAERTVAGAEPDSVSRSTAFERCTDEGWLAEAGPFVAETPLGPPISAGDRAVRVLLAQRTDLRGARVVVVVSSERA